MVDYVVIEIALLSRAVVVNVDITAVDVSFRGVTAERGFVWLLNVRLNRLFRVVRVSTVEVGTISWVVVGAIGVSVGCAIGIITVHVVVDAINQAQVDEAVIVDGLIGGGGLRVREGDVVAAKVVTLVAVVLVQSWHRVVAFVERLEDGAAQSSKVHLPNFRVLDEDLVLIALAVFGNREELLDLWADNWPLGWHSQGQKATKIVVFEENFLLFFELFGEARIDEEDWRLLLLVVSFNWFVDAAAW